MVLAVLGAMLCGERFALLVAMYTVMLVVVVLPTVVLTVLMLLVMTVAE